MTLQTHKTIIFEEFNVAKSENLFTIISNTSSGKISEELEALTVYSFRNFMEKNFFPKVYEVCQSVDGKIFLVENDTEILLWLQDLQNEYQYTNIKKRIDERQLNLLNGVV